MKNPVTLLTADQPDHCGRVFPKEIVESIANQINENKEHKFFGYVDRHFEEKDNFNTIAFTVSSAHIEGDELKVNIKFLGTSKGKHIEEISQFVELDFRVNGIGSMFNGVVNYFDVKYFSCYPKESSKNVDFTHT